MKTFAAILIGALLGMITFVLLILALTEPLTTAQDTSMVKAKACLKVMT